MGLSLDFTLRKVVWRDDYTNPQWNFLDYALKNYFWSNLAHQCENRMALIGTNGTSKSVLMTIIDDQVDSHASPPVYKGH